MGILNLVLWYYGSSAAIPFFTLVALLALWFGVSVPLTFVGAYFGFRKAPIEQPVRTNQIPRQIPDQSVYTQPIPGIIMGGVLPFGCIFIQLFFVLNSIWSSQIYYMYGFLFLVFIILIITCSETTILLCYFHLCAEDYHWWWRSFLTSGFTAFYLAVYCIHYFITKLDIVGSASTFLYFGYTSVMVFCFFLLTGTIGFLACFWFVRKIYSVVKVDLEKLCTRKTSFASPIFICFLFLQFPSFSIVKISCVQPSPIFPIPGVLGRPDPETWFSDPRTEMSICPLNLVLGILDKTKHFLRNIVPAPLSCPVIVR